MCTRRDCADFALMLQDASDWMSSSSPSLSTPSMNSATAVRPAARLSGDAASSARVCTFRSWSSLRVRPRHGGRRRSRTRPRPRQRKGLTSAVMVVQPTCEVRGWIGSRSVRFVWRRLWPDVSPLVAEQESVVEADVHSGEGGRLALASDLVPLKLRPEVLVVGHACAPEGQPGPSLVARVAVGESDKAIQVVGDGCFDREGWPDDPEPFTRMPLVSTWALLREPAGEKLAVGRRDADAPGCPAAGGRCRRRSRAPALHRLPATDTRCGSGGGATFGAAWERRNLQEVPRDATSVARGST